MSLTSYPVTRLLKSKASSFVFGGQTSLSQVLASTYLSGCWLLLHCLTSKCFPNVLPHFLKSSKSLTESHSINPELEHLIKVNFSSQNSALIIGQALITIYKDHSRDSTVSEERATDIRPLESTFLSMESSWFLLLSEVGQHVPADLALPADPTTGG